MTLAEIADLVCEKVGKTDTTSQALAKKFVYRRYVMIHDSELWSETLALVSLNIIAGWNQLIYPPGVDRVLAVRRDPDTTLFPASYGEFFQYDPEIFERTGQPTNFIPMSSAALRLIGPPSPTYAPVSVVSDADLDFGKKVTVHGDPLLGEKDETVQLNGLYIINTNGSFTSPLSISKDVTIGTVSVGLNGNTADSLNELSPKQTTSSFARVRVTPTPTDAATFLSKVKRSVVPLIENGDCPAIRGCEDALIAFAQADMLERFRQYSKAQLKQTEGLAQMAKMRDMERNQQASSCRIIPVVDNYEDYYQTHNTL